ncbi:XRE family transcriptional regulator [Neoroseomonas lacus]|uniref:Repressor n=1 Tax=Neoroseomonas lacus TaxID=287609 RepID=A0A917KHA9_9PROT|nr:helix-turn-helix domain-containing protein [Neoroseomonas lacus]GGJ14024.1 repressor [Neoroseomonas lacus]
MANMLKVLREAAGLTQAALAARINTTQSQIDRLEKGERRLTVDWMTRLGGALGVEPAALMAPVEGGVAIPLPPPLPQRHEMPRDVPVFGTAMGANGDGAFTINLGGQVDMVRRGPGIANSRGVFAIYVEGESMAPRFQPGELVYLDKNRPIRMGDDVVLVVEMPGKGDEPRAYLKRLMRRTADRWICEQFNPPKTVEFDVASLKDKFRVLTLNEVMGV